MTTTRNTSKSQASRRRLFALAMGVCLLAWTGAIAPPVAASDDCDATVTSDDSIQDAINDANDGETLCVEAGTYEESLSISLNEFTLEGVGSSQVTIDASGESTRAIDASSVTDLTLAGFTLVGGDNYGIKAFDIVGFTVEDVTVKASANTGLDLHTVDDVEIEDVEAKSNGGNGITVRNAENVAITNAFTTNNAWGGLAFYAPNDPTDETPDDETVKNVVVTDSEFTDEATGIYFQYDGYSDVRIEGSTFEKNDVGIGLYDDLPGTPEADEVTVRHNVFDGHSDFAIQNNGDGVVDATQNWWGAVYGPYHDDNPLPFGGDTVSDNVDFTPWCVTIGCAALGATA